MINEFLLDGKFAVVCGSTQGIGRATAEIFAVHGASVLLIARNKTALAEVCEHLSAEKGQKHQWLAADFDHPETLKAVISEWLDKNSQPVHILVNNSGGPPAGLAIDADEQAYRIAFNRHLVCNQILAQALTPRMKQVKYGRIINIISTSVKQPIPGLGVSNTIRGAVANWAKTLAGELGPFGITVNNVLPGATETQRLFDIIDKHARAANRDFETEAERMRAGIPARRFAAPVEIANAIVFLASPAAGYVNGINLPVDGGRTSSL